MKATDLTISDVAAELRCRRENVIRLVKTGALRGYDITPPDGRRKAYRITRKDLDAFKLERSAQQHKPTRRRTRAVRDAAFVEYF